MVEFITEHAIPLIEKGGPLMIPLTVLAIIIYFAGFETYLFLVRHRFQKIDVNEWGAWVDRPDDGEGKCGEIIRYTQANTNDPGEVRARFDEVRQAFLPRVSRRVRFITILSGAAPLTGLLGTVVGMFSTFKGLSVSTGGRTIDLVAGGISEALITTQAGLVIAIPAYLLINRIERHRTELEAFFIRLESVTLQRVRRRQMLDERRLAS